jgi:hypothetical protein
MTNDSQILPTTAWILFYNTWKENCWKWQTYCSESHQWLFHFNTPTFSISFSATFGYNVLNTVPTCRRNRNRKGEKKGHVYSNPLYRTLKVWFVPILGLIHYICRCSTHGRWRLQGFLPQLDEFYFTTAEKKILENCRSGGIVPNFMNDSFISIRSTALSPAPTL